MSSDLVQRMRARQLADRLRSSSGPQPVDDGGGADTVVHGLAVPYDTPTGDGRMVARGSLAWDLAEGGVPLIWDRHEGDHTGMTIGVVDDMESDESGLYVIAARLLATDDSEASAAVARVTELISEGALGWSVSLDDMDVESQYTEPEVSETSDGQVTVRYRANDSLDVVKAARVRHIAIVDTPAFPGARPMMGVEPVNASVAAVATYPAEHFQEWDSVEQVPLQVSTDGRVWGHAAGDGCYRGDQTTCRKYTPDPDPMMRNFHTGTIQLDNGESARVGSLTAASLHATPSGPVESQRRHHEDTSTVWAKVRAWNDCRGRLCVSGSIVPGLDQTFVSQVAGQPLSVELWPVPGVSGVTLVGAHTVNTPAWPVTN